ncbi:acetyltransferase [Marinomonas mediterranea]|uniref:acetyltransferase n=1 Tax=Marinomonas mediterranea TaxID=119864 RepID=UPI002349326C|nr:acetyltransferase [Marinomonas mediterranea]WCN10499.1 acyltransferase [Marinomonas mediterranea]WCN14548.1 acyltransferase [Marinomonas mediterranea]
MKFSCIVQNVLGRFPLLRPLVGLISFLFMCFNVLFWAGGLHIIAIGFLFPRRFNESKVNETCNQCFAGWIRTSYWWFNKVLGVEWQFDDGMKRDSASWHLSIANHQSWVDVFIILSQLEGRVVPPRVFMKQALFWIPLIGTATRIMGFPFMKRHSKEKLIKRPELAGEDLETTRRSCKRFAKTPNTVLSFVEGTRYTERKHRQQSSPYGRLLKPKAGGIGFVLKAMPGKFEDIIDINVVYPDKQNSFWDLLCGRLAAAKVSVRNIAIPAFLKEPDTDPLGRDREAFFSWFNQYWYEKDRRLDAEIKTWEQELAREKRSQTRESSAMK